MPRLKLENTVTRELGFDTERPPLGRRTRSELPPHHHATREPRGEQDANDALSTTTKTNRTCPTGRMIPGIYPR